MSKLLMAIWYKKQKAISPIMTMTIGMMKQALWMPKTPIKTFCIVMFAPQ